MGFAEFQRLAGLGEGQHIDRKIECHAFAPDSDGAKAELAKDICAMANNGSRASYLLIGVSNDGRHLKAVKNPNLTDDNLQTFCKEAIHPPPKVRLHINVAL
jgi:predicted HTH transcriptional regulator